MGTYATTTSLQVTMIGFTFDTATSALATKCLTWAENEINKKLAKLWDVSDWTAGNVPPMITSFAEDLAEGKMHFHLGRGSKESLARMDAITRPVMRNIDDLIRGSAILVDTSGAQIPFQSGRPGVLCNTANYTPTFGEDSDLDWVIDPDKIDDIESSRD